VLKVAQFWTTLSNCGCFLPGNKDSNPWLWDSNLLALPQNSQKDSNLRIPIRGFVSPLQFYRPAEPARDDRPRPPRWSPSPCDPCSRVRSRCRCPTTVCLPSRGRSRPLVSKPRLLVLHFFLFFSFLPCFFLSFPLFVSSSFYVLIAFVFRALARRKPSVIQHTQR
jgi:hypothetical protein